MGLFSFLSQEVAIDLGTANTNIIANDKLVVLVIQSYRLFQPGPIV